MAIRKIVGPPARGDDSFDFFDREEELALTWQRLEGGNVLLALPFGGGHDTGTVRCSEVSWGGHRTCFCRLRGGSPRRAAGTGDHHLLGAWAPPKGPQCFRSGAHPWIGGWPVGASRVELLPEESWATMSPNGAIPRAMPTPPARPPTRVQTRHGWNLPSVGWDIRSGSKGLAHSGAVRPLAVSRVAEAVSHGYTPRSSGVRSVRGAGCQPGLNPSLADRVSGPCLPGPSRGR